MKSNDTFLALFVASQKVGLELCAGKTSTQYFHVSSAECSTLAQHKVG